MELLIYGWPLDYKLAPQSQLESTREHAGFMIKSYEASIISGSNNHQTYVVIKFI
jgi:hypothetical protein